MTFCVPSYSEARPWRHWYNKQRWLTLRSRQLWDEPLCEMCREAGRIEAATVVDHKQPHKGEPELFWDRHNLQSLCRAHHDVSKQRDENRGFIGGATVAGLPLDPAHHWNA
jgi:5-methylcytosine-specific restriction enzyme A